MDCKRQDLSQQQPGYSLEQQQQEEDEDVEEEEEEEGAIDDERDEDEEDDEDEGQDEDDADEERGDQEQQDYEQDFERVGAAGNLLSDGGVPSLALCLVSPVASQQLPQGGRMEGAQEVGSDAKPGIRADWTEPATRALLDAWGERYVLVNKGNLKQEHWEEVAVVVNSLSNVQKTDVQCKNRLDTLKKKYKVEKQKQSGIGSSDTKWPYYKQLDKLLSAAAIKQGGIPGAVDAGQPVKSFALRTPKGEKRFKGFRKFAVEEHPAVAPNNNASTCSRSKESPDMTFSSPQNALGTNGTGTHSGIRKRKSIDTHFKTLAKAITKFGEIYEKMEQSKQQQLMDLEKIRMEFTRDLELQRMQLFMQTQVELAKMKYGGNDIEATISNLSG